MTTETTPPTTEAQLLDFIRETTTAARKIQSAASTLNQYGFMPWTMRAKLRTVEGHADTLQDKLLDLALSFGTEEAEDLVSELWPDE